MKNHLLVGIVLAVLGAAVVGYDHYTYTTNDKILEIGPITATAEKEHTVSFPPILGWALFAAGISLIIISQRRK
jgi:hypothetical protein